MLTIDQRRQITELLGGCPDIHRFQKIESLLCFIDTLVALELMPETGGLFFKRPAEQHEKLCQIMDKIDALINEVEVLDPQRGLIPDPYTLGLIDKGYIFAQEGHGYHQGVLLACPLKDHAGLGFDAIQEFRKAIKCAIEKSEEDGNKASRERGGSRKKRSIAENFVNMYRHIFLCWPDRGSEGSSVAILDIIFDAAGIKTEGRGTQHHLKKAVNDEMLIFMNDPKEQENLKHKRPKKNKLRLR